MEGSVFTTRTWILLVAAGLLVTAGGLNVTQRAKHQTPPTDGVTWADTQDGVTAKAIENNSAAARNYVLPGDRLRGIRLNGIDEEVVHARDVQMYLDQAKVGGQITYLLERPTYPVESRYYWADLDNLPAVDNWTLRELYVNAIGVVFLIVGFFVLFKQGGRSPFVLHFATLCLTGFVFLFFASVTTYRDLDLAIAYL